MIDLNTPFFSNLTNVARSNLITILFDNLQVDLLRLLIFQKNDQTDEIIYRVNLP